MCARPNLRLSIRYPARSYCASKILIIMDLVPEPARIQLVTSRARDASLPIGTPARPSSRGRRRRVDEKPYWFVPLFKFKCHRTRQTRYAYTENTAWLRGPVMYNQLWSHNTRITVLTAAHIYTTYVCKVSLWQLSCTSERNRYSFIPCSLIWIILSQTHIPFVVANVSLESRVVRNDLFVIVFIRIRIFCVKRHRWPMYEY